MKARIKATGEEIEIMQVYEKGESFFVRLDMLNTTEVRYHINELEFEGFETEGKFAETCLNGIKQGIDYNPDYWTRLEHQAAIAAMQSILQTMPRVSNPDKYMKAAIDLSAKIAHALVEKYKKEEK